MNTANESTQRAPLAALYVQDYDDPVVLSAVDQIEDLTTSLSRKTWQKLTINNQMQADSAFESRGDFPNQLD